MTLHPQPDGRADVDDLIAALILQEDRAPRDLIDACARRGTAMRDALRPFVGPAADWDDCESDGHWWLRLHAAFILGLMDDAESGLLLLDMMRRFAADEDEVLEDWLSGYWPALFRNKPEAILPEVEAFAWGPQATTYVRAHAVEVLLAAAFRRGPEALDACLARIAEWVANAQTDRDDQMLVADLLLGFPRPAHRALLDGLAASDGRDLVFFDGRDVQKAYAGPDAPEWKRFENPWDFYSPRQIAARQKRWAEERRDRQNRLGDASRIDDALFQEPYVRDQPKVGRNDPCPCGSGKKHKKCCLGTIAPA